MTNSLRSTSSSPRLIAVARPIYRILSLPQLWLLASVAAFLLAAAVRLGAFLTINL